MTEYIVGRVYSGIINGRRETLIRTPEDSPAPYRWACGTGWWSEDDVADIHGPLITLDIPDFDGARWRQFAHDLIYSEVADDLLYVGFFDVSNQIKAQTKVTEPPRKIGWHKVECGGTRAILHWDGVDWHGVAGHKRRTADWTSIGFIGTGDDE